MFARPASYAFGRTKTWRPLVGGALDDMKVLPLWLSDTHDPSVVLPTVRLPVRGRFWPPRSRRVSSPSSGRHVRLLVTVRFVTVLPPTKMSGPWGFGPV